MTINSLSESYEKCRFNAENGDPAAQSNLGVMYSKGLGVSRDAKTAFRWYKLSAEQGNPEGQSNLGMAYYQGKGIKKDIVRAHMWLDLATTNGKHGGVLMLNIVAKMMTYKQIENARQLADVCKKNNYKGF